MIKAELTISHSTSSDNGNDTKCLVFMALSTIVDLLTTTSDVEEVITKGDEDEQDELLDSYN